MIKTLTAAEFRRGATNGRTKPLLVMCEDDDGKGYELFAKFSAGCDLKVTSLARELIAALLGIDLGLPVPTPCFVDVPEEWASVIPDLPTRALVQSSASMAFGSEYLQGYSVWNTGSSLTEPMLDVAASIFLFDGIIQNVDRRVGNSNCLVRGERLGLIDHEAAFSVDGVLGWIAPWKPGGMRYLVGPEIHIFFKELKRKSLDFSSAERAWKSLSDERLKEYELAIPDQWAEARASIQSALKLIRDARDNIGGCLEEVQRVLQ